MLHRRSNFHLLLALLLFSCKQGTDIQPAIYVDEPAGITRLVSDTTIQLDIKAIPASIGLVDTVLVVMNKAQSPYLNFYASSDLHYMGSFGAKGDLPGELSNPQFDNQFVKEPSGIKFYLLDYKKNAIEKFSLVSVLSASNAKPEKLLRLHPSLVNHYSNAFVIDDNLIVGNLTITPQKKEGRFFTYSLKEHTLSTIPYFPKIPGDSAWSISPYYYYSHMGVSGTGHTIASAMHRFKRVDFIEFNGNDVIVKPIIFSDHKNIFPTGYQSMSPPAGSTIFYVAAFAGNQSFYAFCVNDTEEAYGANKGSMQLHEFSWDGKLKNVYNLDRIYLGRFCVNEKNRRLFVINFGPDKKTKPILIYHLPK